MKVKLARTAGFCMGVRRAIELVLTEANKAKGPIYTFGPIIHNQQVIDLLESKGVKASQDLSLLQGATTIIRAHGIPPDQRKALKQINTRLVDGTCPHVARVQALVRYYTHKGYHAIIVGDFNHPEVIGLMGYGEDRSFVIKHEADIASLPASEKTLVVAQTTQDEYHYQNIVKALKEKYPGILVFDTICNATQKRQAEIRSFAGQVDGIVVVGGYHSGNTRRLVKIAHDMGVPAFHIETSEELDKKALSSMNNIGVTAGASTPNWMIKNVVSSIEEIAGSKEALWTRWFLKIIKLLFLSNLMVAMGAFSLAYAGLLLCNNKPDFLHPLLTFLYIYAMYVINRFLDKGATIYNDPERALFYRRHKAWLLFSGVGAILISLGIAFHLGPKVFFAMLGFNILGISYNIPIVPRWIKRFWRYSKFKDIPGSKTVFKALAWSAVITLIPVLETHATDWPSTTIAFLYIFSLVFIRSGLFEICEAQGDRIVGIETLPTTLGEKKTLLLLKLINVLIILVLSFAPLIKTVNFFATLLILPLFALYLTILAYEKKRVFPGFLLEALLEGVLISAGLLGLLYRYFR